MTPEQAAQLRESFPASAIGKLPKAGIQLDYVGHAAVTDRLLQVDPDWTWEPVAFDPYGTPLVIHRADHAVLWIRLTVCGVTRPGVGIVQSKAFELEKQLISDALRNAAMRFGVALDLWSKEDLSADSGPELKPPDSHGSVSSGPEQNAEAKHQGKSGDGVVVGVVTAASAISVEAAPVASAPGVSSSRPPADGDTPGPSQNQLQQAKSRVSALVAAKVKVADERERRLLPPLKPPISDEEFTLWLEMLSELEANLAAV